MSTIDDEIDTLNCWRCLGIRQRTKCGKCGGSGRLFWTGGYAYAGTPAGEKEAREAMRLETRLRR